MAKERKVQIYKEDYFKSLPNKAKEYIYTGTIELLKGYLSFDSTMVAATGGGAALLAGRLASMWAIYPALMSLCVEILKKQDLIQAFKTEEEENAAKEEESKDLGAITQDGEDSEETQEQ